MKYIYEGKRWQKKNKQIKKPKTSSDLFFSYRGDLYLAFADWFFQSKAEHLSQIGQALTSTLKCNF